LYFGIVFFARFLFLSPSIDFDALAEAKFAQMAQRGVWLVTSADALE